MDNSVTLDPPGTGKRCTLKERACASSLRARAEEGDSGVRRDKVVALWGGKGREEEFGGEDGGEW